MNVLNAIQKSAEGFSYNCEKLKHPGRYPEGFPVINQNTLNFLDSCVSTGESIMIGVTLIDSCMEKASRQSVLLDIDQVHALMYDIITTGTSTLRLCLAIVDKAEESPTGYDPITYISGIAAAKIGDELSSLLLGVESYMKYFLENNEELSLGELEFDLPFINKEGKANKRGPDSLIRVLAHNMKLSLEGIQKN